MQHQFQTDETVDIYTTKDPVTGKMLSEIERETVEDRMIENYDAHLNFEDDLLLIWRKKLFIPGWNSFLSYCRCKWPHEVSSIYKKVKALETMEAIQAAFSQDLSVGDSMFLDNCPNSSTSVSTSSVPHPTHDGQMRPLFSLPVEDRANAWAEAVREAEGEVPTEKQVRSVVEERIHRIEPTVAPNSEPTEQPHEKVKSYFFYATEMVWDGLGLKMVITRPETENDRQEKRKPFRQEVYIKANRLLEAGVPISTDPALLPEEGEYAKEKDLSIQKYVAERKAIAQRNKEREEAVAKNGHGKLFEEGESEWE